MQQAIYHWLIYMHNIIKIDMKRPALITGFSLILMALFAGFVYGYVHEMVYVPTDTEQTGRLLREHFALYRLGIASWIGIIILDFVVSIGIYQMYRKTDRNLALLTSAFRIFYTLFLGYAVGYLAVPLFNNDEIGNGIFYFESFGKIWSYGLVIFGIHLFALSVVCFKSLFTPKAIAALLGVGGVSYMFIEGSKSFFPSLGLVTPIIEEILTVPMAAGELAFAIWLIIISIRFKEQTS